ncbi:MAG: class I SAM-dependent methyltransferase [Cellvibrionaceae bacterium]
MLKIICNNQHHLSIAKSLAVRLNVAVEFDLNLKNLPPHTLALLFDHNGVSLNAIDEQKTGAVYVDFVHGKLGYRLRHNEAKPLIAKAVGIKSGVLPSIWDLTAGLGQDGFILAKLGCEVQMFERNAIVHCLLQDGLLRANHSASELNDDVLRALLDRLSLVSEDAINVLSEAANNAAIPKPSVIYLDPMFPDRKKTAKVKKGMQLFHQLVGRDSDSDKLLELALHVAESRVVVKRPKGASVLAGQEPSLQFHGKTLRFDVYPLKKMGK